MAKVKANKKRSFFRRFSICIIYQIVFVIVTMPVLVFYGPFNNVKKTIVGSAMSTFKTKYIATLFLSKASIDKIINSDGSDSSNENMDTGQIKVKNMDNSVNIYDIHTNKFDGYIMEVNPRSIRIGYTKKLGVEGQRTSVIAEENGAIAAINGGGFSDKSPDGKLWAGTGAFPDGIIISGGRTIYSGVSPDTKVTATGFTKDGTMIIGNYSINDLKKLGVVEALSFSGINSRLIINGKPQIHGDGGQGLAPRTAIAQKKDGTVLLLVIDGRKYLQLKAGASLKDIQDIFLSYGAWNASNLDGGSSSTMYYDGEVINSPSDPLGERAVASIVYVKP